MEEKPIFVTQPELPPLKDFIPYLEEIWSNKILTNSGPFHQKFEKELAEYLGVEHISLFSNGTLALITALKSLGLTGEVITTPYTFVATAHSLNWNGLKPVFVDIEPNSFNIDPDRIEAAITPETRAILPVHCYGYPCDVDRIQSIADKYRLKVIYDAAHAFGVQDSRGSVLRYGDMSIISFHATKVFNTFEGGAVICPDADVKKKIDCLKNFGIEDEETVLGLGINGKMNEIQAAMGLLQLEHVDTSIKRRKDIDYTYRQGLNDCKGLVIPEMPSSSRHNFSYFPILVTDEYPLSRDELCEELKKSNIFSRRYFYPLISDLPMYSKSGFNKKEHNSRANNIAAKVLCLPIYPKLSNQEIDEIIGLLGKWS